MSYRVVYGETMPAWEREFETRWQAEAFAKKRERCGDIIFSVAKVGLAGEIRGLFKRGEAHGWQSDKEADGGSTDLT